jgi:hypothetical protein
VNLDVRFKSGKPRPAREAKRVGALTVAIVGLVVIVALVAITAILLIGSPEAMTALVELLRIIAEGP